MFVCVCVRALVEKWKWKVRDVKIQTTSHVPASHFLTSQNLKTLTLVSKSFPLSEIACTNQNATFGPYCAVARAEAALSAWSSLQVLQQHLQQPLDSYSTLCLMKWVHMTWHTVSTVTFFAFTHLGDVYKSPLMSVVIKLREEKESIEMTVGPPHNPFIHSGVKIGKNLSC